MDAADLARIRLVTTRYRELQGLRTVAAVAACVPLFWLQPYIRLLRYMGSAEAVAGLLLSVAPAVLITTAHPLLNRYYARRFGSVAPQGSGVNLQMWLWAAVLFASLWLDSSRLGTGSPSAFLIAAALWSINIAVRDWPWRGHYVVPAVICGAATWSIAGIPALQAPDLETYARIPVSVGLVACGAAAILDHRLLVTTLGARDGDRSELALEHADTL